VRDEANRKSDWNVNEVCPLSIASELLRRLPTDVELLRIEAASVGEMVPSSCSFSHSMSDQRQEGQVPVFCSQGSMQATWK
jgi:hypothetical protein